MLWVEEIVWFIWFSAQFEPVYRLEKYRLESKPILLRELIAQVLVRQNWWVLTYGYSNLQEFKTKFKGWIFRSEPRDRIIVIIMVSTLILIPPLCLPLTETYCYPRFLWKHTEHPETGVRKPDVPEGRQDFVACRIKFIESFMNYHKSLRMHAQYIITNLDLLRNQGDTQE